MENKQKILTLRELSEILQKLDGYYLSLTLFKYGIKEPGFDETLQCQIHVMLYGGKNFNAKIVYDKVNDLFRIIRDFGYVFLHVAEVHGLLLSASARPIEDILDISVDEKSHYKQYRVDTKNLIFNFAYIIRSDTIPGIYLKRDFEAAGRYDLLLKIS